MKLKVGIIGLGYWGPNYVRNFKKNPSTEVAWCCDISQAALDSVKLEYPEIQLTKDYTEILRDTSVDCIAIATPPENHYKIAKDALLAGKHIFIAKPLATNYSDALKLVRLAKKKNLVLFSDFTYLYTKSVEFIKNYIKHDGIGNPLYYDSVRSNLGIIQKSVNVIWDLAPHDLAIIDFCFGLNPKKVFAIGSKHYKSSVNEEMAHITITYENNFVAHIHVSWLSPIKLRTILIGGSKKMVYFNDVVEDEKVKIYNKGVDIPKKQVTPFKPLYRIGDIVVPRISSAEALYSEVNDFVKKINRKKFNNEDSARELRIIRILEACDESLAKGKSVVIKSS